MVLQLERYRSGNLPSDIDASIVSKRLLELGYEADPERYALASCMILSPTAHEAATQSELQFCSHSQLPFALTNNVTTDAAQQLFTQVQSYMRRTLDWEKNAISLVQSGVNHPENRDEILCELMMQLLVRLISILHSSFICCEDDALTLFEYRAGQ